MLVSPGFLVGSVVPAVLGVVVVFLWKAAGDVDDDTCPPIVALRGLPLMMLLDWMDEPMSAGRMTT